MKLLLLVPTVALFTFSATAQKVTSLENTSFILNSYGNNQLLGGRNITCFDAYIPFGTKQLICAISTNTGSTPKAISLTGQILDYYHKTNQPVFENMLSLLSGTTTSEAALDFYVYGFPTCAQLLINRADRQCSPLDATQNITGGIFYFDRAAIQTMQGKKCSFCLVNNDLARAVYASVELTLIE